MLYRASIWAPAAILAITLHEAAHAWAAYRLGDDTAYKLGRVTFNPLRHLDPIGTVLLPAIQFVLSGWFLFGWAKPVPISVHKLRQPRCDMILVALAGPGSNLLLALISVWAIRWVGLLPEAAAAWAGQALRISVFMNLVLAVFNLLPLPPLDGGRVAVGLLPDGLAFALARLERYGLFILVGVLFLLPLLLRPFGVDLDLFGSVILEPTLWIYRGLAGQMGVL